MTQVGGVTGAAWAEPAAGVSNIETPKDEGKVCFDTYFDHYASRRC